MPFIETVLISWRIALTAAPSAAFLSPRPTRRPAASAAASVTRASSRARFRSGADGSVSTCIRPSSGRRALRTPADIGLSVILRSSQGAGRLERPGGIVVRLVVARLLADGGGQARSRSLQPLFADRGQSLALLPQFERLLQCEPARFEALDQVD